MCSQLDCELLETQNLVLPLHTDTTQRSLKQWMNRDRIACCRQVFTSPSAVSWLTTITPQLKRDTELAEKRFSKKKGTASGPHGTNGAQGHVPAHFAHSHQDPAPQTLARPGGRSDAGPLPRLTIRRVQFYEMVSCRNQFQNTFSDNLELKNRDLILSKINHCKKSVISTYLISIMIF